MEFKEILKFFKKHTLKILLLAGVSCFIGVALYFFLPVKYTASGNLYVTRKIEPVSTEFSYEGYYSQQAAFLYTKTVIKLLESLEIRKEVLNTLGVEPTDTVLQKYGRRITVRDTDSQLILLKVIADSSKEAATLWQSLVTTVVEKSALINKPGDLGISVSSVSGAPVVQKVYRSVWLNGLLGFGFGVFVAVFIFALKEYLS